LLCEACKIGHEFIDRIAIVLLDGKFKQVIGVGEPRGQRVQHRHDLLEPCPFLAEGLGTLGLVPDIRFFELALDLGQAFRLTVVVKDTPLTR
jgi:hypothetical protein